MNEELREPVKMPEEEAAALMKALRHRKDLSMFSLSVYAYVNAKGVRALHVAVDLPLGVDGDYERYDIRYRADQPIETMSRNAAKRIKARFALQDLK